MDLLNCSKKELQELCEEMDIRSYKSKTKAELIALIESKAEQIERDNSKKEIKEEDLKNTFTPFQQQ
uniref:Rho termination factor-like N-terminal domain-containing protein n=1 Tax=viral metagenome TaxID=1070528 RepID=A0A6C0JJ70_9ZZZZ